LLSYGSGALKLLLFNEEAERSDFRLVVDFFRW
jgi:hypothetical protein